MILLIFSTYLNLFSNEVYVKRADSTIIPYSGMRIVETDTIITGDSSKAEIIYSDSSNVFINENSRITARDDEKKSLYMTVGSVWARIRNLFGGVFDIDSPISVSGVRGTEFCVSYRNGIAETKVIEGKVSVKHKETGEEVRIEKEDFALIKRGEKLKLMKFKLENLRRWNRWKENNLKFVLKRVEEAIENGEILRASHLIDQGYMLMERLKTEEVYGAKLKKYREDVINLKKKQGSIKQRLRDIRYSINKTEPLIERLDYQLEDINFLLERLRENKDELRDFIKRDMRLQATELNRNLNILLNRIEDRISNIPELRVRKISVEFEEHENYLKSLRKKGLEEQIADRITDMEDNVKTINREITKIIEDIKEIKLKYRSIKLEINKLRRDIQER